MKKETSLHDTETPPTDYSSQTDYESLWEQSKGVLRDQVNPQIYTAFIKPLRFSRFDSTSSRLTVCAPSKLVVHHVIEKFSGKIERLFSDHFGLELGLKVSLEESDIGATRPSEDKYVVVKKTSLERSSRIRSSAEADHSGSSNLTARYTFSNFVVGNNNQFCHAAAVQVSEKPGTSYNPLFIYGGVGLGKTHLMHAIGNAILARDKKARVVYMSSETFTNELIQSLRFGKMDSFKSKMRSVDLLLIDDIQFMSGKERTQEEFFHTFNALYSAKNQIVITSDRLPQDIEGIEDRLITRFSWGLTADLQAPDFETRVAILNRKATIDGFTLARDVSHYIAESVSSNVRELEGALTRIHAQSSLQNIPMSLSLAEMALKPLLKQRVVRIGISDIRRVVCEHFGIKESEIISKRRTKNLSFPRHVAMYLCRKHTTSSYPEIGTFFGGRDHSSVIHAANVVSGKLDSDEELKDHIRRIEDKLLK
jgi:chromosomal replication initiator protein